MSLFNRSFWTQIFSLDKPTDGKLESFQWKNDTVAVIDCETTGKNPLQDAIISLSIVPIVKGSIPIEKCRNFAFRPEGLFENKSANIHGILNQEILSFPPQKQVAKRVAEELSLYSVWAGHHLAFDLAFLDQCWIKCKTSPISRPYWDTAQLCKSIDYGPFWEQAHYPLQHYSLDSLCSRFGIEILDRHTSWGDAMATALLMIKIAKLIESNGQNEINDYLLHP